jgi:hypothetical protein
MKTIHLQQQVIRSLCAILLFCLLTSTSTNVVASSAFKPLGSLEASPDRSLALSIEDDAFLNELAKDTWTYLASDWATDNHLPWSWRSESIAGGDYANVTEIGFYALSWIAAYDLQRSWSPNWATTEAEVSAILDQLRAWQTGSQTQQPYGPNAYQHSVFYQWYWINNTPPVVGSNAGDNHVVPSVDNAWLAASLMTIREYAEANNHSSLSQKANAILNDMDFTLWYNNSTHRFLWGGVENPQGGGPADYFSNENRIINFVARALGQLSESQFQLSLQALNKPSGTYNGITVERMAWDGSYFTYAGPALFIRETDTLYGLNTILPATRAQIQYANDQNHAVWGLSDSFDLGSGGYVQQGAPPAATPGPTETRPGLVTPHASALALITQLAPEATTNLQKISTTFNCYDPSYGFHDSVMTKTGASYGNCSDRFSALAQEWIFLSLVNHENGFIWRYLYKDRSVVDTHAEMYDPIMAPDTTGVFRPSNGLLYLKNTNDTGFADIAINYGIPDDDPVVGDWDGNGTVTIGIYRNGTFYLRNSNTIGFANIAFPFGLSGDQPIAGDWDGDGVDTIGVFRPSTGLFLLRNSNDAGPAEMSFFLGNVGDVGVAGDWNGDGFDTTGVFRPSNGVIFLKNTNNTGFADIALNYGIPGDQPVMGDWNNDGIDTIGIYRNGTFYLRNSNTNGFAEIVFGLGNPGDMPIAGDWDGSP